MADEGLIPRLPRVDDTLEKWLERDCGLDSAAIREICTVCQEEKVSVQMIPMLYQRLPKSKVD